MRRVAYLSTSTLVLMISWQLLTAILRNNIFRHHLSTKLSCSSMNWINYQCKTGLKYPSDEQKLIISTVYSQNNNIIVNAVAGSGKTTTLLHIANVLNLNIDKKSILALLYNTRLKDETRQKRDDLGLNNLEVHSYHAFAVKYYRAFDASKDTGIVRLNKQNPSPAVPYEFDVIVLDEVQDMTPLLFKFTCKIIHDNMKPCRIIILGDERQNIFDFLEADARYLTKAEEVFGPFNSFPWKSLKLQTSFRITRNIADFMNKNVLHYPLFDVIKPAGDKVMYYRGNPFKIVREISNCLTDLLENNECKESDIFILAPSVKLGQADNKTPLNILANELQRNGYQFFVPLSDDSTLDKKVIQGKIVISSFHQSKGLERKVVIVFNFNRSYFDYYAKHENTNVIPNTLYVACTRATEILILVGEDEENGCLPFLKEIHNSPHLKVFDIGKLKPGEEKPVDVSRPSVVKLTKHLPESVLYNAMKYIKYEEISPIVENIKLKSHVQTTSDKFEEVFDINGIALPALYEQRTTKSMSTVQRNCLKVLKKALGSDNETSGFLAEVNKTFNDRNITDFLRLATIYSYANSGFMNKAVQIKDYDWITNGDAEKCLDILRKHLKIEIKYEVQVKVKEPRTGKPDKIVEITGIIDAITDDAIWELKCTEKLESEHLLQLAIYAWMSQNPNLQNTSTNKKKLFMKSRQFKLLNMRTGQLYALTSSYEELTAIYEILIENYLKGDPKKDDQTFMKKVKKDRKQFIKISRVKVATKEQLISHEIIEEDSIGKNSTVVKKKKKTSKSIMSNITELQISI